MSSKKRKQPKSRLQVSAKQSDRTGQIIAALIGALGVIIAASIGYLGTRTQTFVPLEATQTAASLLWTVTIGSETLPTLTAELSPTAIQATTPPLTTSTTSPTVVTPASTLPPGTVPAGGRVTPGTYLVGTQIQPGIYRGEAGEDVLHACYWKRMRDLSGTLGSIIANQNSIGQFYVEVQEADFALETRCELVPLDLLPTPTGAFPQTIEPGMYLLGRDIQAGTYRGEAPTDAVASCHWARLRDVSGEVNSNIARQSALGQFYVQVEPDDFAFWTTCQLTRIGN